MPVITVTNLTSSVVQFQTDGLAFISFAVLGNQTVTKTVSDAQLTALEPQLNQSQTAHYITWVSADDPASSADGASSSNFVFQPGGTASGNVYTSWASLHAALSLVKGYRTVQFDSSLQTCVIPAGSWSMIDVELTGFRRQGQGFPAVQIANGCSLPGLAKIGGDISLTNLNNTTAPIVITASTVFEFGTGPSADYPTITNTGTAPFIDYSALASGSFAFRMQGIVQGTGSPAIYGGASAATCALVMRDGATFKAGHWSCSNTAATLFLAIGGGAEIDRQFNWAGNISFGQPSTQASPATVIVPRQIVIPQSLLQAAPIPSTAALTFATGLGWNAIMLLNPTAGDIAQTMPVVRATATIGQGQSTAGVLNSLGMRTTFVNTAAANNIVLSPAAGETINGAGSSLTILPGKSVTLVSDGISNAWVIATT